MNLYLPLSRLNALFSMDIGARVVCGLISSVCLMGFGLTGCSSSAPPASVAEEDSVTEDSSPIAGTITVEIVIDPKDAAQTIIKQAEVIDRATLESVMANLDGVEIQSSGSGVTAFIHSINGVETTADRGWTFTIDGEFASEGIGSTKLVPGQMVQWKFATFEEAMK